VSVVDTASSTVKDTIHFKLTGMRSTDITPVGLSFSPDGASVWVGLGKANHVARIDASSRKVLATVLVGKRAWGLGFNKSGSQLYVTNGMSDDVTLVDTAQAKAVRSVPAGRVPHSVLVRD
jgi:YVTN family beta-propeller protein